MKIRNLLFLFILLAFVACDDDDYDASEQLKKDIAKIEDYLAENNITAQSTESGLYYYIEEQGTGATPELTSIVTVNYTGWLLDGTQFDKSTNALVLSDLVKGWQEGLQLIQAGGTIHLYIPSTLGYKNEEHGDIPKNSVLIFKIQLISVID